MEDTFFMFADSCDEHTAANTPTDSARSFAKLSVLSKIGDRIQQLTMPCSDFGRQVFTAVNQVIRAQPQQTDVLYLAEALLKLGFDVVVRRVRGDATSGEQVFRALRHEFLVVRGTGDFSGMEFIVEPSLRQHFAIPHPTPDYDYVLSRTPDVFVGGSCRLVPVVQLLCAFMADSFTRQDLPLPPWRQEAAMLSKWLPQPHHFKDREVATAANPSPQRPRLLRLPMRADGAPAPMANKLNPNRLTDDVTTKDRDALPMELQLCLPNGRCHDRHCEIDSEGNSLSSLLTISGLQSVISRLSSSSSSGSLSGMSASQDNGNGSTSASDCCGGDTSPLPIYGRFGVVSGMDDSGHFGTTATATTTEAVAAASPRHWQSMPQFAVADCEMDGCAAAGVSTALFIEQRRAEAAIPIPLTDAYKVPGPQSSMKEELRAEGVNVTPLANNMPNWACWGSAAFPATAATAIATVSAAKATKANGSAASSKPRERSMPFSLLTAGLQQAIPSESCGTGVQL